MKSCIQLGKEKTEFFAINVGVRQGCVLSPLLFSIFINNLAKDLAKSGIGIKINGRRIASLFYADYIVLITENEADLKKGLEIAAIFGRKWRCSYNKIKTKVVIFGKKKSLK